MSAAERQAQGRGVEHGSFTIERDYGAPPERVFAAWAHAQAKRTWFGPPELAAGDYALDFHEGGGERMRISMPDGAAYSFEATYRDIVHAQRIVYTYEMHRDEARMSVSVATVSFEPVGGGTRLRMTEQGVYLDALDTNAQREHGTNEVLDALGRALETTGAGEA